MNSGHAWQPGGVRSSQVRCPVHMPCRAISRTANPSHPLPHTFGISPNGPGKKYTTEKSRRKFLCSSAGSGFESNAKEEEPPNPVVMGVRVSFEDIYYYINVVYWSLLFLSVIVENKWLEALSHFRNFVSALSLVSSVFAIWYAIRWFQDIRQHLGSAERKRDAQGLLRYGWRAVFWLASLLWYIAPPIDIITEWTGTPGAIMCLYGLSLAGTSALMVGSVRDRRMIVAVPSFLSSFSNSASSNEIISTMLAPFVFHPGIIPDQHTSSPPIPFIMSNAVVVFRRTACPNALSHHGAVCFAPSSPGVGQHALPGRIQFIWRCCCFRNRIRGIIFIVLHSSSSQRGGNVGSCLHFQIPPLQRKGARFCVGPCVASDSRSRAHVEILHWTVCCSD